MSEIFGIDTSKKYGVSDVKKAVIKCFISAHSEHVMGKDEDIDKLSTQTNIKQVKKFKEEYILELIKKFFQEVGADFENPSKEDIFKAINRMREFSLRYRNKSVIDANYNKIKKLLDGVN